MKRIFLRRHIEQQYKYRVFKKSEDNQRDVPGLIGKLLVLFAVPWLFFGIYEIVKEGVEHWKFTVVVFGIAFLFLIPGIGLIIEQNRHSRISKSPLKVTKK